MQINYLYWFSLWSLLTFIYFQEGVNFYYTQYSDMFNIVCIDGIKLKKIILLKKIIHDIWYYPKVQLTWWPYLFKMNIKTFFYFPYIYFLYLLLKMIMYIKTTQSTLVLHILFYRKNLTKYSYYLTYRKFP